MPSKVNTSAYSLPGIPILEVEFTNVTMRTGLLCKMDYVLYEYLSARLWWVVGAVISSFVKEEQCS